MYYRKLFPCTFFFLLFCCLNALSQTWDKPYPGNEPGVLYYPDQYASYFRYGWKNDGSQVLVIKGRLPKARYFSFNLYNDATKGSLVAIADHMVKTDPDGSYTIYIVPPNDTHPYQNRISIPDSVRLPSVFLRYYVAEGDIYASVPLPAVYILKGAELVPAPPSIPIPSAGSGQASAIKRILKEDPKRLSFKEKRQLKSDKTAAKRKEELVCKIMTMPVFRHYQYPGNAAAYNFQSDGNYPNKDNHYILMPVVRKKGMVLLVRFKPPTFTTVLGDVSKEVRYFSISQGDEFTRTSLTLHDTQLKVAEDGFIYVAVAPDTSALGSAGPKQVNIMPWYHKKYMVLILRHMLPSPAFSGSTDLVPLFDPGKPVTEQSSQRFIGDYGLVGVYVKAAELKGSDSMGKYFLTSKNNDQKNALFNTDPNRPGDHLIDLHQVSPCTRRWPPFLPAAS